MPESRKRRSKKHNRQRLAAVDGKRVVMPGACCAHLTIELGVGRINVKHDNNCAALDDREPGFLAARAMANAAVGRVLNDQDVGPIVVIMR